MSTSAKARRAIFTADLPLYYYVTDRIQLLDGDLLGAVRRALRWGVDFVQIREKDLCDRELFTLTRRIVRLAEGKCRVLINGRADIALAAGAQGVHLPSGALSVWDLRRHVPEGFLIGVSVHSRREARLAVESGADYVLAGPIYPTPSKRHYGTPLGLARFRGICNSVAVPVIGLGGIHPAQVAEVLAAGAVGVAGITLFQKELETLPRGPKAPIRGI